MTSNAYKILHIRHFLYPDQDQSFQFHCPPKAGVAGSNPAGRANLSRHLRYLVLAYMPQNLALRDDEAHGFPHAMRENASIYKQQFDIIGMGRPSPLQVLVQEQEYS